MVVGMGKVSKTLPQKNKHTCNPSYLGNEMESEAYLGKIMRPYVRNNLKKPNRLMHTQVVVSA